MGYSRPSPAGRRSRGTAVYTSAAKPWAGEHCVHTPTATQKGPPCKWPGKGKFVAPIHGGRLSRLAHLARGEDLFLTPRRTESESNQDRPLHGSPFLLRPSVLVGMSTSSSSITPGEKVTGDSSLQNRLERREDVECPRVGCPAPASSAPSCPSESPPSRDIGSANIY